MDTNNLTCPSCGGELFREDAFDFDFEPNEVSVQCVGHCKLCGKVWCWMSHYKYDHSDSFDDQTEEFEVDE